MKKLLIGAFVLSLSTSGVRAMDVETTKELTTEEREAQQKKAIEALVKLQEILEQMDAPAESNQEQQSE